MEIKNRTCIPTQILESLIKEGIKNVECKDTNFKIQFNPGKYLSGMAYSKNNYCKIIVPISRKGISFIWQTDFDLGQRIYEVIVHELKHIADFQNQIYMGTYHQKKTNRPCEIRAIEAEQLAIQNMPLNLLDKLNEFLKIQREKNGWN